jgi:hypothetical protein
MPAADKAVEPSGTVATYNLGELGVVLTKSEVHGEDGELAKAQNAMPNSEGGLSGIRKRLGMAKLNASAAAGAIRAYVNVALVVASVPAAPAPPVAEDGTDILTTSFTANWAPSAGASGYRLDVSTSYVFADFIAGFEDRDVGPATSRGLTGLSIASTYFYRVRAYNTDATSASSNMIEVTTVS